MEIIEIWIVVIAVTALMAKISDVIADMLDI